MGEAADPLAAEREFFTALVAAGREALDRVLADDFSLIDVMRGAEITKAALLAVLGSGQLRFQVIEPAAQRVRLYRATAVVTGRTRLSGRFGGRRARPAAATPTSTSSSTVDGAWSRHRGRRSRRSQNSRRPNPARRKGRT